MSIKINARVSFVESKDAAVVDAALESAANTDSHLPSDWTLWRVQKVDLNHNHEYPTKAAPPAKNSDRHLLRRSSTEAIQHFCIVEATRQFTTISPKFSKAGGSRVACFVRFLKDSVTHMGFTSDVTRNILTAFESK